MAESTKFIIIRKLMKALGLSDESIDDVIQWIEDLLSGEGKKELADYPYKLRDASLSHAGVKAIAIDAIRFLTMQKQSGPLSKKFCPLIRRRSHA
jgi:hypothetical protein